MNCWKFVNIFPCQNFAPYGNLEGAKGAYCRVFSMYIYLFIGLSRFNLFTMPGIQCVVYTKSSKVLAATSCCLYCLLP